jgi:hypothetical protein
VSDVDPPSAASDPSFFDGRVMIDILAWNWSLRLRIGNPAAAGMKARFQGLDYGRDFIIRGQVRAPRELRGKTIEVVLSPFGPDVRFGRGGLQQVGTLKSQSQHSRLEFKATLMLPEDAIAPTVASLASTWKHLQILTEDEPGGARITSYFFQASIHPNMEGWANAD